MDIPNLTEQSFGDFMINNLKSCHENRIKIYSIILNVSVIVIFALIVGLFLYYRYKEKPTAYELQQKMYRDQQFILDKIRYYQVQQKNLMTSPIGNF